jgi:hypothetical protein
MSRTFRDPRTPPLGWKSEWNRPRVATSAFGETCQRRRGNGHLLDQVRCVHDAIANAVTKVNRPALFAVYNAACAGWRQPCQGSSKRSRLCAPIWTPCHARLSWDSGGHRHTRERRYESHASNLFGGKGGTCFPCSPPLSPCFGVVQSDAWRQIKRFCVPDVYQHWRKAWHRRRRPSWHS